MSKRTATHLARASSAKLRVRRVTLTALPLCAVPGIAHAGFFDSGCATNTGISADVGTIGSIVNWFVSPLATADSTIASLGMNLATSYSGTAYTVAGLLATAWFLWCVLRELADGGSNYVALVLDASVPMAITSATLHLYSQVVQGLAGAFSGAVPTAAGGVSVGITTFATSILTAFANAINSVLQTTNCFSMWTYAKAVLTGNLGPILHAYMMVFLLFIALVLAVIAVAEVVGVMLVGSMFAGVALAVGPIFIATGISPWTRRLMKGWINFLGAAYLYKGLISVVLTLIAPVVTSYTTNNQASLNSPTGPSLGSALALIACLWVLRHVILGIPRMAKALAGGHAHSVSAVGDAAGFVTRAYKIAGAMK